MIFDEEHHYNFTPELATETLQGVVSEPLIKAEQLMLSGMKSAMYMEPFKLENRRYIGNKAKLVDWIMGLIDENTENVDSFCDIFAGTGSVTKRALQRYRHVVMNDFLYSNNIIYKAFYGAGYWDRDKLCRILDHYNQIDLFELEENYFSKNFGDKYFERSNAKMIGYIRQDIEEHKANLTEKEYCILLASLIYSIDRIANTVGHFDAYIKKDIKPQRLYIKLVDANSYPNVAIYKEDSNLLVRNIYADVTYMDPPYNSRQYCRFYHLYETLVKWDKPKLYGVALKPKAENMSGYLQPIITQYFIDNKSEIWLLFLIAHSKR
ncbi:DNA adenine methylase [uncultured Prevotella sp.]|uniref:DNA adenine methylase n=1 Tax=uncultured Prevotella sp. TaxID=159272 RepID=UPI002805CB7D|nr:DNA adenine methylase [uncultured Prevotella sp.]MDU3908348.1 DNA adenine methylase [Prevotella bivia]